MTEGNRWVPGSNAGSKVATESGEQRVADIRAGKILVNPDRISDAQRVMNSGTATQGDRRAAEAMLEKAGIPLK